MTNNPFTMGEISEERTKYTAESVVESYTATASQTAFPLVWQAKINATTSKLEGGKVLVNGTETTAYTAALNASTGIVTVTLTTGCTAGDAVRIGYVYDNQIVPFNNGVGTMPHIKAEMKSIALQAKAR